MDLISVLVVAVPALVLVAAIALFLVLRRNDDTSFEDRLTQLESTVSSTVRSLTFFDDSTGKKITTARLTSRPARIIDQVAEGNINMSLLPASAGLISTIASMAAENGSELKRHSHQHHVDIFIAEGQAAIYSPGEALRLYKGDAKHFDPGVEKRIKFEQDTVLIWTFTPALEEYTENNIG